MKILVTGGAGFIGSNFIRHITSRYPEHTIINLDKLTYAGNLENPPAGRGVLSIGCDRTHWLLALDKM